MQHRIDAVVQLVDPGQRFDDLAVIGQVQPRERAPGLRRRDEVEVERRPARLEQRTDAARPSFPLPPVTATFPLIRVNLQPTPG